MEFRNIATFLCVAEKESFTKAAKELGYVQSTVSMQIQQLEEEIGACLFERIGKHVMITPSGQKFLEYANQMLQIVQEAKLLGKQPEEIVGSLRIGILESLLEWIMVDCVPHFYQNFPNVSIETKTASGNDLVNMLKHNELDFIFLLDRKISERNCKCVFSARENIVFVTNPWHPLASKDEARLADILQYPLILTERNGTYRQALENVVAQKNMYISPFLEINNTSAIVKLLHKQVGIAFLPEYTVRESVAKGNLVLLPVVDCPMQLWCQMFYHENKWVTPQMRGLMQMIEQYYRDGVIRRIGNYNP
jgi:DNA-binding transcriptional LysR family regulator